MAYARIRPISGRIKFSVHTTIIVSNEIGRGGVLGKRISDLVGKPFCGGIGRDPDPDDPSSSQSKDNKGEEPFKRQRGYDEKIYSCNTVSMITQKCLPALGGRAPAPQHVFRHCRLSDINTELQELTMNARRSPKRVFLAHAVDQIAQLAMSLRASPRIS